MKTQNTKSPNPKAQLTANSVKDLEPREVDVKAGSLTLNFTKVEFKQTGYDDQHKL